MQSLRSTVAMAPSTPAAIWIEQNQQQLQQLQPQNNQVTQLQQKVLQLTQQLNNQQQQPWEPGRSNSNGILCVVLIAFVI